MQYFALLRTTMFARMRFGISTALVYGVFFLLGISIISGFLFIYNNQSQARNITTFSDTLTDSAPGEYSNHTIEFQLDVAVPAGGYIRITPEDGAFTIPAVDFDIDQVELFVAPPSLGYTVRAASSTADATYDGIAITTGTSGNVLYTLNASAGISAGSDVRIKIGTHTTNSTTTDVGVLNPVATGTRQILIEAGGGASDATARALVAIIDSVGVGPVDTTEEIPPVRFNGAPTGTLSGTVTGVEISLETDEFARCRFSTASGTPFLSMTDEFTVTGSIFHSLVRTGLSADTTYTFFVRCIDDENNYNIDDYEITFTIPPPPEGTPGDGDDGSDGEDDGSGSGDDGSGDGTTGGDEDSDESGGGTRGGGGGGGGTNSDDDVYESGDATVIISGYSFPSSKVSILVDGDIADTVTANSAGVFSVTLDAIARGVYSFGAYATDRSNVKSSTFSTTFTVTGSRVSTLSNINLMPSISVAPNPVDVGATVTFSGYAIANSTITIETQQDKNGTSPKTLTATSDGIGKWSATQSTAGFAKDKWKVRAKSAQIEGSISTNFSQYTYYAVGTAAVPPTGNNSDLNRDGKVNLIDFSILLFHWNTNGGASDPPADINRDGRVSLTDFSIMIFNWTG